MALTENQITILLAIVMITTIILYNNAEIVVVEVPVELPIKNISDCQNLTFYEQTECIKKYIKPHYNYTIRTDIDRSISEVFENGGDCYDWAHVWAKLAKQLGLNARVEYIYGIENGHAITIIWNKNLTGYCIADTSEVNCI